MVSLHRLVRRGDGKELNSTTINLLISLLVLILFGITLVSVLLLLRKKRRAAKAVDIEQANQPSHHRRLTITATPYSGRSESVYVIDEKRNLVENSSSPPSSPVPEIRITFPEEEDTNGRRRPGSVVVVRIGEKGGIGLEPCPEQLPPYPTDSSDRFQSLDLNRMGGLKEKDDTKRYS
ncbi:hypothetical protein LOZ53_000481 [Ophidiomyces ophidiicola]|uniref:Uncharacterized protein n=1 Tax=Ophidiomyces ophidiicola TaxID=1387563 RepID=A0ACB8V4D4_9EURO|nr:uncharacterized protein LOZ57_001746 [Ophidiomyces ophidiicola]KAI1911751.1 hypothetical protein LOZ64_004629 [Ophidiomyces ophidiicola]KAI1914047.1 hypothetical protein LOZ61_002466 [Ophidiomyces ophidiicola]KAI1929549.1 hypothetical protein LOZ60_001571 [Ophidiomyces ophidiicola]KAI1943403.1 hypothetical protein LOZ62_004309 [Ophidiomyces ophidiicola]KAI1951192.1 hypothetical protein LOZ57_001746 [Ophidiomyces ophidiicola]